MVAAAKKADYSNLKATPFPSSNDGLEFEAVTGQRAKASKEERRQRDRQDSLDDHSSGSESDVETYLKQKKQEKKDASK